MNQSSKMSAWLHWYFSSVPVQSLVSLTRETRFRSSPPPSLEHIVRKQALWVFEKLNCVKWASHWPEATSCHQMLEEWWQTIWRQQGEKGSRKRVFGLGLSAPSPSSGSLKSKIVVLQLAVMTFGLCPSLRPHRLIIRWPQAECFCQTRSFGLAICSLAYRVTGKPRKDCSPQLSCASLVAQQ